MKIIDLDIDQKNTEKKYIALGNFDGLHLAHMEIIDDLIEKSKASGHKSSILIFKDHTFKSLGKNGKVLTSLKQKLEILKEKNLDYAYLISFDKLKDLDVASFFKFLLKLKVRGIFVGFDYKFGKNAKGNIDMLKEFSENENIFLSVSSPIYYKENLVSSSLIRELVSKNDFDKAEAFLSRPYFLEGKVVSGKKLGSKLGFPTANINLKEDYSLGQEGVYFSQLRYENEIYYAATSLGRNISFGEEEVKIEAHILNFHKDIYGASVEIRFIKKLRPMIKYDKIEDLIDQVKADIDYVAYLGGL